MSVSVKHKEVKTGLKNLMTHMKNDYNAWSMRGRTVHSNTEDFIRATEIREDMEKRYADGLGYDVNTKYIKVFSAAGGGKSVCCFVVATETDKKFKFGTILKPGSWKGPARNFARGNILTNDFRGVSWTGC